MKNIRFILILTVLLVLYSAVMIAIICPWAWAAIGIGVVIVLGKKSSNLWAHGTARWADIRDLWGMTNGGNGLIVGEVESRIGIVPALNNLFDKSVPPDIACQQFLYSLNRKKRPALVRLNKAVHTMCVAPVGVGKSSGVAIPFLLTSKESCVVVDFKGELSTSTAAVRRKMGHQVVILDPFKVVTQNPDTFNPLLQIDASNPLALDECRDLAAAIVVRTGQEKEPHWADSAELWIAAMIATVVAFAEPKDRSLQAVRDLLTDPMKMEAAIKLMCESTVWNGMLARLGHQLTQFKDKELNSTLTTTNRFLRFLDTLAVFDSTKTSSFNPDDLLKGKMTVYLVIPPEHMTAQAALLRLWIGSMLRAVVRGGLQEKNKVHFILDEAASLGKMDALTDAVDKYRGYGIRLQLYYQSLGQLKKCWPDGQDQTLLSNVTQMFFGVNDNETAKYVSDRLGEETIIVSSGGRGTSKSSQAGEQGKSSLTYGSSTNDNWAQQARRLLKPEEVTALSERTAIIFTPGVPPIWTTLVRYYEAGFRNLIRKSCPAVKAFCHAAFLLLAVGCFAVFLTLIVNVESTRARERSHQQRVMK